MKCGSVPAELLMQFGYNLKAGTYLAPAASIDREIEKTVKAIKSGTAKLETLKSNRAAILEKHSSVINWPVQ